MPSTASVDERFMRALSIRQPYAELILRGIKTAELRSRPTRVVGERFLIYACKTRAAWDQRSEVRSQRSAGSALTSDLRPLTSSTLTSDNLAAAPGPPAWMIELAEQVRMIEPGAVLPTGVIVGSAVIAAVSRAGDDLYRWHLTDVQRATKLRKPTGHPQPVWFRAF